MAQPSPFGGSLPTYVRDAQTGVWYVVGGGGQSVDPQPIDWHTDVDTVTNPPQHAQALTWDDIRLNWIPGGPHLKLSGGAMDPNADIILGVNPPPDPLSATPRDYVDTGLATKADINHSHAGGTSAYRGEYLWTLNTDTTAWVDASMGADTVRFDTASRIYISKTQADGILTTDWWVLVNPNDRLLIIDSGLQSKGEYTVLSAPIDHGNMIELEVGVLPGCTPNVPVVNDRVMFIYFQQTVQGVFLPTVGGQMTGNIDFRDDGEGIILSNGARFSKELTGTTTIRKGADNGQPQIAEAGGASPRDILDTLNGLPLVGGLMTGDIEFASEGEGILLPNGSMFSTNVSSHKTVIKRNPDNTQPQLINQDGSNPSDILDQIKGNTLYSSISHTHPPDPIVATLARVVGANGASVTDGMDMVFKLGNLVMWQVTVIVGANIAENSWVPVCQLTDASYLPTAPQFELIVGNEDSNNGNGVAFKAQLGVDGFAYYYKFDAGHNFSTTTSLSFKFTYLVP